jgi:PASTA domain.
VTGRGKKTAVLAITAALFATAASLANAELTQRGDLFVSFSGGIAPAALPRHALAPIAVSVAGEVRTLSGERPPALRQIAIELNRSGHLDSRGLPLIGIFALLGALAIGPASASATLPPYVGDVSFPTIHGPSDPEEFSWEVILAEGAYLESVDDQTAEVYYENGHPAFGITAEPAHDALGTPVPTSLSISAGNVITLVVHHRAGNPAAGGAPFDYPILAGVGWEGGYGGPVIVKGPPDEAELREEREKIAREREAQARAGKARGTCLVPRLKGRSLKAAKKRLEEAGCGIGAVRKRQGSTAKNAKVVKQSPRPGVVLAPGATVTVLLGR